MSINVWYLCVQACEWGLEHAYVCVCVRVCACVCDSPISTSLVVIHLLRGEEGLAFMKFSVYLLIWVVYIFTLSHYSTCLAYTFLSWNKIFYGVKHRFVTCSIIPKCLFWWNNACTLPNFFLMLVGCYCRLPDRMFIWLVIESVSIWYVLYFTWYESTKYGLSLKAVFSIILFSHKFYFLRNFSQAFLNLQPWNFT